MLFSFLRYLQPTHYFQLPMRNGVSVFPKVEALPAEWYAHLKRDTKFESDIARDYDMSWQAVQKGYVSAASSYGEIDEVSVHDNYHFIRKYFHKAWVLYVLVYRLLTFNNPITELKGWYATRGIQRVPPVAFGIYDDDYASFKSTLLAAQPKVSVIIPTLNRYHYLTDVLNDLEAQTYSNFEVIVVDQSDNFNKAFYDDFNLNFQIINQKEKALWLARNRAIKTSKGELIALSEDDVRIAPNWISAHLKCLDYFKAEVSAGVFYPEGQHIPKERSFFTIASQFATGNAMLYKSVFKTVGLFDRQFEKQRMGDGEFGMRLYLAGIKSISNPKASCVDVKAGTGGLRELGSWDAFRPSNVFAPRPIPSVLYYFRRYFGNTAARRALWRSVPLSIMPYQFKKNKPLLVLGALIGILLLPLVVCQVWRSWHLATKKIAQGPLIDHLP